MEDPAGSIRCHVLIKKSFAQVHKEINQNATNGEEDNCLTNVNLDFENDDVFEDNDGTRDDYDTNGQSTQLYGIRLVSNKNLDFHDEVSEISCSSALTQFSYKSALEERAKSKLPNEPLDAALQIEAIRLKARIKRRMEPMFYFNEQKDTMAAYEWTIQMEECGETTSDYQSSEANGNCHSLSPIIENPGNTGFTFLNTSPLFA